MALDQKDIRDEVLMALRCIRRAVDLYPNHLARYHND